MWKKIIVSTLCSMTLSVSSTLLAMEIVGNEPVKASVPVNKPSHSLQATPSKKDVFLMKMKLTPQEKQTLFSYNPQTTFAKKASNQYLPFSVNLGMNGVPVLDQGYHGSCVVFATTAAIDALLGKGDYISQLCHLELGRYLENNSFRKSGWDGSFGPWEIEQIMRFGIVSKATEKTKSCAGVTQYPLLDENNQGNMMSPEEFQRLGEDLQKKLFPVYMMNVHQRFKLDSTGVDPFDEILALVKRSLAKGNRVMMGTILLLPSTCGAGACATHNAPFDTWALTSDLDPQFDDIAGHEMVIIGYDDLAYAKDRQGKIHHGLLILRNSWGEEAGDHGNYYMTYDYFKTFADELQAFVAM